MFPSPFNIDLWVWRIDGGAEEARTYDDVLSNDEKARADRFLNPSHGYSFKIAHGRMRGILGQWIGAEPASLAFAVGPNGKPSLTGLAAPPAFNLTHSGALAALAVADAGDIGVDIEEIRPIRENIAERYFSVSEVAQLRALPIAEQDDAFFRCWTRKEAIVKALGDGLTMPLDRFTVDITTDTEAGLQASFDTEPAASWRLLPFRPADGYHGAIAVRTKGRPITVTRHG
jgi:4'-phosphopantetheinyl transferase